MHTAWYVAKVQRGRESALRQQLEPAGVELYHPEIVVHKHGRRLLEPLFPSYLFFKGDPGDATWVLVRRARGLKYILGSDYQPTPVAPHIVETVRARVREWNAGGWRHIFLPGQSVRVAAGPFKGLDAIFVQYIPARERCRILIATVHAQHGVEIDVGLVSRLSPAGNLPSLKP